MNGTINVNEKNCVFKLTDLAQISPGQAKKQMLSDTDGAMLILLAFDTGAVIPPHRAEGDGLIQVLEGRLAVQIDDRKEQTLEAGFSLVMGSNVLRSLKALEPTRALVTVIRPEGKTEEGESHGC